MVCHFFDYNSCLLYTSKQETISPKELKSTLARCVEILKDYPIRDVTPLRQIFTHFTNRSGLVLRYDYINIVNSWQDEMLHHLNDVIKTVDPDSVSYTHLQKRLTFSQPKQVAHRMLYLHLMLLIWQESLLLLLKSFP